MTTTPNVNAPPDECWEWTGRLNASGYGVVTSVFVHRTLYELFSGPIPEGLQIDHLCRNKRCANPTHLEAVTRSENVRRSPRIGPAMCKRGHSEWRTRSDGSRQCIPCAKSRDQARIRSRAKAAA